MNPNLTEINTWSLNVVSLLQTIGYAVAGIIICVSAIVLITSLGNPQKQESVKISLGSIMVGLFLLMGAWKFAGILQALAGFLKTP